MCEKVKESNSTLLVRLLGNINKQQTSRDRRPFFFEPRPVESEAAETLRKHWDSIFSKQSVSGTAGQNEPNTLLSHIASASCETFDEQLHMLGTISNFHWRPPYTSGKKRNSNVLTTQQVMCHPAAASSEYGALIYLPMSPRCRLGYQILRLSADESHDDALLKLIQVVKYIVNCDTHGVFEWAPVEANLTVQDETVSPMTPSPIKRLSRSRLTRPISLTRKSLLEKFNEKENTIDTNFATAHQSPFLSFKDDLLTDGIIHWRSHSLLENTVVMNDYLIQGDRKGEMLPNSFVHVTAVACDEGLIIKCSCQMYNLMINTQFPQGMDILKLQEYYIAGQLTCMHCRMFREELTNVRYGETIPDNPTNIERKIFQTQNVLNQPVVLLGDASIHKTTKLSVKGVTTENGVDESFAMVHVTFTKGRCHIRCLEGVCLAQSKKVKKKVAKSFSLTSESRSQMCIHLQAVEANVEILHELFPTYFGEDPDPQEPQEAALADLEALNCPPEETNFHTDSSDLSFDIQSGVWTSRIAGMQTVSYTMDDPNLVESTMKRNHQVLTGTMREDGYIVGRDFDLVPPALDTNGEPLPCQCQVK